METMIEQAVKFHGHICPGLMIGIRAVQIARREFGSPWSESDMVAVSETSN